MAYPHTRTPGVLCTYEWGVRELCEEWTSSDAHLGLNAQLRTDCVLTFRSSGRSGLVLCSLGTRI